MDLSMDNATAGERTVIAVGGEIDVYTAPKLRDGLVELINSGHYHLVVDLEGVDFLDSTGLGVLVGALKRVRSHQGTLALVCTQERLLKIFRITGTCQGFPDLRLGRGRHRRDGVTYSNRGTSPSAAEVARLRREFRA